MLGHVGMIHLILCVGSLGYDSSHLVCWVTWVSFISSCVLGHLGMIHLILCVGSLGYHSSHLAFFYSVME